MCVDSGVCFMITRYAKKPKKQYRGYLAMLMVLVLMLFVIIITGCEMQKSKSSLSSTTVQQPSQKDKGDQLAGKTIAPNDLTKYSDIVESKVGVKYEQSISDAFEEYDFVEVEVGVKRSEFANVSVQEVVLSSLSESEFILHHASSVGSGFNGYLSQSGFEKLLVNQKVVYVYGPKINTVE